MCGCHRGTGSHRILRFASLASHPVEWSPSPWVSRFQFSEELSRFFTAAAFFSPQRSFSLTWPHALTLAASAVRYAGAVRTVMESETSRTAPAVCGHCLPLICTFAGQKAVKRPLTDWSLVNKGRGGEWSGLRQCDGP